MGRPSSYSDAIATEICESIAQGKALYRECETRADWPHESTIYRWIDDNPHFRERYARARERCADRRAEEIVVIADEEKDPAKARVMVEARKWQASKLAPKKYSDRITNVVEGGDKPIEVEQTSARRRAALALLLARE